jgi:hypothetical protein
VARLTTLELIRRLLLGLLVGFFCITAGLLLQYGLAHQPRPQPTAAEMTLVASSASTVVVFIANVVTGILIRRKDKKLNNGGPHTRRSS